MARHYAYLRASTFDQKLSTEVQREGIDVAARRESVAIDTWVEDADTSGKVRFDQREGGGELCRMARKGDTIWIAKMDRAFRSVSDCAALIQRWARDGVGLRIVDFGGPIDLSSPAGKFLVHILASANEFEREMISTRTRETAAMLKKQGRCNTNHPGYGFKWRRLWDAKLGKYYKVRVSDPVERAVMGEIAKWRIDGVDFETIYHHLRKLGVKTSQGKEWSIDRIKRAYQAELKLQQTENPRATA